MRIAHVTATFLPYYSGTGHVAYHSALQLAQRGHQVTVFTAAHPPGGQIFPTEITVRRLPVALRLGNAPLLPGLLGLRGFDLIHLHYPFYSGAEMVALAARRSLTPFIVTYHQDVLLGGLAGFATHLHDRTVGAWTLCSADRVLFTTLDYARASRVRWLLDVRPQSVSELPNGVDVQRFHPQLDGSAVRERHELPKDAFVLLLVAGLDRAHFFKGISVLLRALQQLNAPNVHLLIVGDGDLRAQYQAEAARLGLAARVAFVGRVSSEALPSYYAAADVVVLPSTTRGEAFGLVLIEAMACGKPVIASNLPGVRTVVDAGHNGLLAVPGDSASLAQQISALHSAPEETRRRMGAHGRAKAESLYAWPQVVERLEAVYCSVLRSSITTNVGQYGH